MPQDIQPKCTLFIAQRTSHSTDQCIYNALETRQERDKNKKDWNTRLHCQCCCHSFDTNGYRSVTELTLDERRTERSTSTPRKEDNAIKRGCTDCENWLWLGPGLADAECALTDGTNAPQCAPLSLVLTSAALPAAAAAAAMLPITTPTTTTTLSLPLFLSNLNQA